MNNSLKLPSIDYKEFKILTLCKNKEFANINHMADELKVTTRSVRTYIKQLNENLGEDIAQIIYVKGYGYKLEIKNKEAFELLFEENKKISFDFNVKDERILYLLDFFTEFNDVITIDQLAEQISVGRTTIVNDIKSTREILNEYNLDLIKKQNYGMWLKGNEFDKRLLLINYIYKDSKNDLKNSKYVNEVDTRLLKQLKTKILRLFKEDNFYATNQIFEETVLKDVAFGPQNFGVSEEDAERIAREKLALVGIAESLFDRSPFELSGGQMRRVAIAGILAMEPAILVLDEPTAGLDPLGRKELMNLFKKLHQSGMTIVLVTHLMDDVAEYANQVYVMEKGRLVKGGKPSDVFQDVVFMEEVQLGVPKITAFCKRLADRGVSFKRLPIRIEEFKESLNG